MNLTLKREQLLIPLQHAVGVIENRQTMPILANVCLKVSDGKLTLTGTDLELQVVSTISIDSDFNGGVTLPAKKLLELCRLLPDNSSIKLVVDGDKAKLTSGKTRFTLSTLPVENYPNFIEDDYTNTFTINGAKLKQALSNLAPSMASNDVRFYLNGMLLSISTGKIQLVASDGHRLALFDDTLPAEFESKVILPKKFILELAKKLTNDNIQVSLSSNNIRATMGDTVLSSKLIDSKYPDFSKVLRQEFDNITTSKQSLFDSLKRISVLANEKFKGTELNISDHLISLSSRNPEHEEAEDEVACDYNGNPISIGANITYLVEAVSNITNESLTLSIAKNQSCLIIEESEYKFIVMSMRI